MIRVEQRGQREVRHHDRRRAAIAHGAARQTLRASGYVNPLTAGSTEEKLRRMIRRWNISARDAPITLGMLRQVLWKLGKAK